MRKLIVSATALAVLAGPLSTFAHAGVVCAVLEKVGVDNVKDCEGPI